MDLSQALAGPDATMMLADLAARVLKVEALEIGKMSYFPHPVGSPS